MHLISKKLFKSGLNLNQDCIRFHLPGGTDYVQNASGILIRGGGIVGLE